MQTPSTISAAMRPSGGYTPELVSSAVTAVQEPKTSSPESSTVMLSESAKDKYVSDKQEAQKNADAGSAIRQPGQDAAKKAGASEGSGGSDAVEETLERLKELLKEAQQRLRAAQQQMALAMAEMKSAGDEQQKMAAMLKVQAAQALVISAQGEVLEIHAQINNLLQEQQKQAKSGGG